MLLACLLHFVTAETHGHPHSRFHQRSNVHNAQSSGDSLEHPRELHNESVVDVILAEAIVKKGLAAITAANKLRYEHIQFNKNAFRGPPTITPQAPALNYVDILPINASVQPAALGKHKSSQSKNGISYIYTIPSELAEAARIIAEAQAPSPMSGEHSRLANEVRQKYTIKTNDTNAMKQSIVRPDGLFYPPDMSTHGLETQLSVLDIARRADGSSTYWMAGVDQNGKSPFASPDYKVWRNVRDYGAKGLY